MNDAAYTRRAVLSDRSASPRNGAVNTRRVTRPALDNGGRPLYGGSVHEKA
jgi:hypothetical protein